MKDRIFEFPLGDLVWKAYCAVLKAVAFVWRSLLVRTTFVAITGSVGKSSAKECIAAVLATRFPTAKTLGNMNGGHGRARSLLRVRPRHRFAVIEVGIERPGQMRSAGRLVRPDAAVVLRVAKMHTMGFSSEDLTAAEKALLLDALAPGRPAFLNGDDPRVAAMAADRPVVAVRFGTSPAFDVWADEISAVWPDRLSFRVHVGKEDRRVRTRFVGAHWVPSFLAGIVVGHHFGVGLDDAVGAAEGLEPSPGRMQPVPLPGGGTLIRDEYNGSIATLEPALRFLKEARADRRIVVLGDCSDYKGSGRKRPRFLGRLAAEHADVAVFVGSGARHAARSAVLAGLPPDSVHTFDRVEGAAGFLRENERAGDLILIKGRTINHMARAYLALVDDVNCWTQTCPRRVLCDFCPRLRTGRALPFDWIALSRRQW